MRKNLVGINLQNSGRTQNDHFCLINNEAMEQFGIKEALKTLGVSRSNPGVSTGTKWIRSRGTYIESFSPADGKLIGKVQAADEVSFNKVVAQSRKAFQEWRLVPAPKR